MPRPDSRLARTVALAAGAGYTAKGIVYLLVGGLAFLAAIGLGGDNVGTKEALFGLARQPFGDLMITGLGGGLAAYAAWRLLQALLDTEDVGHGLKGLVTRLGFLISGLIHASLSVYCLDLLRDAAEATNNGTASDHTAQVMGHQGGLYVIFAVGLVFIAIGLRQLWRAMRQTYLKNWYRQDLGPLQRRLADIVTRWGLCARGLVFQMIGLFLCLAAWRTDPSEAQGLGGALNVLAAQPFGPWLLGAVALGLASYGLYCLINAAIRDTSLD
ncbi:DUF1206 domain-containing protein [Halomonas sp. ND22Bw]|uniref:DUF1206 domain-containing protein n=1 Tax=Halomonas salina TaxID=42565 RepID=A0ABR4WWK1_9GAMM|nr:DUF1206 domain-containing protein [Halomonas salina]KGE78919.1 hypothetical protein FP66_01135 [Halomonas salina]PSJ22349.1 DUF1206 domain-containing protein [Halomonas sp. ND22Bw]